jgi:hypothetical protein
MKQVLLTIALILVPVTAFTGFQVYAKNDTAATAGLGDLSSLKAIIADVQAIAARGDLTAAAKRITDYESAWDEGRQRSVRSIRPTGEISIKHRTLRSRRCENRPFRRTRSGRLSPP